MTSTASFPYADGGHQVHPVVTAIGYSTADRINEQHELAQRSIKDALEHAVRAGELLLQQKKKLKHGEFMPWVKTNCKFSQATANMYMKATEISQIPNVLGISLRHLYPSGRAHPQRRIASIPEKKPEKAVESDTPPTVTAMVQKGVQRQQHDDVPDDHHDDEGAADGAGEDHDDTDEQHHEEHHDEPVAMVATDSMTIECALAILKKGYPIAAQHVMVEYRQAAAKIRTLRRQLSKAESALASAEQAVIKLAMREQP